MFRSWNSLDAEDRFCRFTSVDTFNLFILRLCHFTFITSFSYYDRKLLFIFVDGMNQFSASRLMGSGDVVIGNNKLYFVMFENLFVYRQFRIDLLDIVFFFHCIACNVERIFSKNKCI